MKNIISIALLLLIVGCAGGNRGGSAGVDYAPTPDSVVDPTSSENPILNEEPKQVSKAEAPASAPVPAKEPIIEQKSTPKPIESTPKPIEPAPINYVTGVPDFSAVLYAQALANKQDIVLDFHADWCHICRDNEPIIRSAVAKLARPDLVVFIVDYDNAKDLRREFNVVTQTTLVMIPDGDTTKQTRFIGPLSAEKATELFSF